MCLLPVFNCLRLSLSLWKLLPLFLLCWIWFLPAFCPILSPLCTSIIPSFEFIFLIFFNMLSCSACQVYFVFCFLFLPLHSFLSFFSEAFQKVLHSDALHLHLSGDFFYPLGVFNSCCSRLQSSDFRSRNLFHCLFLVPLISGLMLDCDHSGHTCVCLGWNDRLVSGPAHVWLWIHCHISVTVTFMKPMIC